METDNQNSKGNMENKVLFCIHKSCEQVAYHTKRKECQEFSRGKSLALNSVLSQNIVQITREIMLSL